MPDEVELRGSAASPAHNVRMQASDQDVQPAVLEDHPGDPVDRRQAAAWRRSRIRPPNSTISTRPAARPLRSDSSGSSRPAAPRSGKAPRHRVDRPEDLVEPLARMGIRPGLAALGRASRGIGQPGSTGSAGSTGPPEPGQPEPGQPAPGQPEPGQPEQRRPRAPGQPSRDSPSRDSPSRESRNRDTRNSGVPTRGGAAGRDREHRPYEERPSVVRKGSGECRSTRRKHGARRHRRPRRGCRCR